MAAPTSKLFSSLTTPGDAVAVLILVEDTAVMSNYWGELKRHYLPTLLETIRAADLTVSMRVCWMNSAPTSRPFTTSIVDTSQCYDIPDYRFDQSTGTGVSSSTLRRCIETLPDIYGQEPHTRHLILVAPSGIIVETSQVSRVDEWYDVAQALNQVHARPHLILSPMTDNSTLSSLFDRCLYFQNLQEVHPWFNVDTTRFAIYLSGKSSETQLLGLPLSQTGLTGLQNTISAPCSPITTSDTSSPTYERAGPSRKNSFSPSTHRNNKPRSHDSSSSSSEGPGLVSYLQQMHGLTKKRSYGTRAPKRTFTVDSRANPSSRPILPRLSLTTSPYPLIPSMHSRAADAGKLAPLPELSSPADQTYSAGSAISPSDERRPRRRGPWLPTPPLDPPASSTHNERSSNALRSLASMTRLTDMHRIYPPGSNLSLGPGFHPAQISPHLLGGTNGSHSGGQAHAPDPYAHLWGGHNYFSSASSPLTPSADDAWNSGKSPHLMHTHNSLPASPSSHTFSDGQVSTPLPSPGLTASTGATDDSEDQPFVVTPEYEALANAQFEEALRVRGMQDSQRNMAPGFPPRMPSHVSSSFTYDASYSGRRGGFDSSAMPPAGLYPQSGNAASDVLHQPDLHCSVTHSEERSYGGQGSAFGTSSSAAWYS